MTTTARVCVESRGVAYNAETRTVVELMKPCHTHFIQIVEPVAAVPDGRWVLGEDDLGARVLA